jgi:hypothetical protein
MRKSIITKANTATQLATQLAENAIVNFSFVKRNGDLRRVNATTKNNLIPKELRSKVTNKESATSVRFFDLNINAWRSVSAESPIYLG